MLTTGTLIVWGLVALIGTALWQVLGKRFFSSETRDRRRRSRNYHRVTSRRHGPSVKLAVKVRRR